MAFTTITLSQIEFLEEYLRGTGRTLTEAQARSLYGIENLRARMTELRQLGLRVRREKNSEGRAKYAISARDENGSRAKIFA